MRLGEVVVDVGWGRINGSWTRFRSTSHAAILRLDVNGLQASQKAARPAAERGRAPRGRGGARRLI
jgi:hypothetical protein